MPLIRHSRTEHSKSIFDYYSENRKHMKKLLFIFNPHSGKGAICRQLAQVLDIFTKAGYEVVAYPTQAARDCVVKIIRDGERFDRIVAAGGDGMLHELINGVLHLSEPKEVGYIPTGTVNDFATSNRIPKNILEAAKVVVSDNIQILDVGNFEGRYFSYVAAFGIGTNVSYDTDQKAKNRWGFLAYAANAIKGLDLAHINAACRKMTVKAGDTTLTGSFVFGSISNSRSIAGMKNLVAKDVELDDGVLDGLFIRKPRNLQEMEQLRNSLIARNFDSDCMYFIRTEQFEIDSEPAVWTLDGENGGEYNHVVISTEKLALRIALPEGS